MEALAPSLNEPEMSFLSAKDEMVARAPILEGRMRTISFNTDMMIFWVLISVITRDLDCRNYVELSQMARYGMKAYRDLWDHFLRPDNVDNMASEAERIVAATH